MPEIQRRKSVTVPIDQIRVGSSAPVVVQSMTNTDTADIPGTVQQIASLARAGSELVRITVNNDDAAKAVPYIVDGIREKRAPAPYPISPLERPDARSNSFGFDDPRCTHFGALRTE